MPPPLHFDPSGLNFDRVVADREAVRCVNQQRFEMELLTAVVHLDPAQGLAVGYCDIPEDVFWARGHMPGYPIMPGVLQCEAAAQLCSFYITALKLVQADFIGFGGMDNVRFRGLVRPGDRLVVVSKLLKFNRRQTLFNVQGFVGAAMVFHADIIGVPMTRQAEVPATAGQEA